MTGRFDHTATLLPNGEVLVAGGLNENIGVIPNQLYDPATGTWRTTGSLNSQRYHHTATLLLNGRILLAGGNNNGGLVASAELYDIGLGFVRSDWQPQVASVSLISSNRLMLTGSRFQGISQASGGNFQDSSSNHPLVQLRNIDNSQVDFLPADPTAGWSDSSFTSTPIGDFPPGPTLVTVFTNGIPSDSNYLVIGAPGTPTPSPTPTVTPTATATPAGTPTPTTTPSSTPTPTPRPSSTPRVTPTPRAEPTSRPRFDSSASAVVEARSSETNHHCQVPKEIQSTVSP